MTRQRLLLVTPVSAANTRSGAEQRSHLLWRAAQRVGQVDVLQLQEGPTTVVSTDEQAGESKWVQAEAAARRWPGARFEPNPSLTAAVEERLGTRLDAYDLIIGRYLWPISQLVLPATAATLVDLDDWRFRHASGAPLTWCSVRTRCTKAFGHWLAKRQLQRFDAAFAVSSLDEAELRHLLPLAFLPNVPCGLPESVFAIPGVQQASFVGSLWYPPNREAVNWLLTAVWPRVRRALPQARLDLLGASSPDERAVWARSPGVQAPGFVEDLARAYASSALILAPMFSGGGTNIKVLEAMGHGRPCLTTPLVMAAFADALVAGRHLLVAESAPAFADHMIAALSNPAALQRVADEGRQLVISRFSTANFERTAADFMARLIAAGRRR